jgi:hypothetical protein
MARRPTPVQFPLLSLARIMGIIWLAARARPSACAWLFGSLGGLVRGADRELRPNIEYLR